MARLPAKAARENIHPDYTASLRAMMDADSANVAETAAPSGAQPLVEPLTHRELEILDLIAQGLSNNDIAERLFLALTTIKGHNQNIFGKLGVKRRTEAVAHARDLGILSSIVKTVPQNSTLVSTQQYPFIGRFHKNNSS